MKVNKSIVPILVQNYYIFGGGCCPNKYNKTKEKENEINTSNNEDKEKTPEETQEEILKKQQEENFKKHQEENLIKINNVKGQAVKLKSEDEIKEEIKNGKKISIEPPKGDKSYSKIVKNIQQKEVEKRNKEEQKEIPTGNGNFKKLNDEFTEDPKIGLQNIGATCYMNATLQCLSHIKELVEYFKYHNNSEFNNSKSLSSSFKTLIENLWNKNTTKKYYAPNDFKEKISILSPLFKGVAANDAKDLINFLIMTLHEELNKVKNPVNNYCSNIFQDQRNSYLMFQNFIKEFTNQNQSIVSDLFYAMNCNTIQCWRCRNRSYNYQTYFFLIFPLEEVRIHNINECQKEYYSNIFNYSNNKCYYNLNKHIDANNKKVTIYDCFNYGLKIDTMAGDNAMYCKYCNQTLPSNMRTTLVTGPKILIIILNRGKGIEFDVKLNFHEELDLGNYIELKDTGTQYKLIGVITHMGGSDMSGHFIATCRDPFSNKWYKFNDATVSEVIDFKNEVINYAMPYVLFYEKVDG